MLDYIINIILYFVQQRWTQDYSAEINLQKEATLVKNKVESYLYEFSILENSTVKRSMNSWIPEISKYFRDLLEEFVEYGTPHIDALYGHQCYARELAMKTKVKEQGVFAFALRSIVRDMIYPYSKREDRRFSENLSGLYRFDRPEWRREMALLVAIYLKLGGKVRWGLGHPKSFLYTYDRVWDFRDRAHLYYHYCSFEETVGGYKEETTSEIWFNIHKLADGQPSWDCGYETGERLQLLLKEGKSQAFLWEGDNLKEELTWGSW